MISQGVHLDVAEQICDWMTEPWLSERKAQIDPWDPGTHARLMLTYEGPAYTAWNGPRPVLIGGLHIIRRGFAVSWMAGVEGWQDQAGEVASFSRRIVRRALDPDIGGLHRVQMVTGAPGIERWVRCLGLRFECELPGFGLNGETFYQYAATRTS